jgi:hypothetical protein
MKFLADSKIYFTVETDDVYGNDYYIEGPILSCPKDDPFYSVQFENDIAERPDAFKKIMKSIVSGKCRNQRRVLSLETVPAGLKYLVMHLVLLPLPLATLVLVYILVASAEHLSH